MAKRIVSLILCLLMLSGSMVLVSAGKEPVVSVVSTNLSAYRGKFCEVVLNVDCDEEVTYQWQAGFIDGYFDMVDLPESDVYKGVNTNHFKLKAVGDLWQLDFRCKITYSGGTIYTDRFVFMFLDNLPIEKIDVTGIDKPKFGNTPDYEIDYVDSYKYKNGIVEWYGPGDDGTGLVKMNNTDVFVEGDYKCRIYLEPIEPYSFNEESVASVDGINCIVTKTLNEDGEDIFYTERFYSVRFNDSVPHGLLDFAERTPATEETQNVYLGSVYLGTDSMNIESAFKPKALPLNMLKRGYYVAENTRIANVKNESLYFENHGKSVNFADYAKEKGKYYIEQTIYLMSPEGERLESKEADYVIDVYEPEVASSAGITFRGVNEWTEPFYTYVARTPEIQFNTMFWYDVTDGKTQINNGDKFINGHTYRMEISVKAATGYVFATDEDGYLDITASVNGMPAEVTPAVSNSAATIVFEFTYEGSTTPTEPSEPSTGDEVEPTEPSTPATDDEVEPTEPSTPATDDEFKPSEPATYDEPTTSTDPSEGTTTTNPSEPAVDKGILGDVDGNGKVNIKDATMIQKAVAKIISLTDAEQIRADVNADAKVNIKDATAIQKYVAKIETGLPIGEKIV